MASEDVERVRRILKQHGIDLTILGAKYINIHYKGAPALQTEGDFRMYDVVNVPLSMGYLPFPPSREEPKQKYLDPPKEEDPEPGRQGY